MSQPFLVIPRVGQFLRIVSLPLIKPASSPQYDGLFEYGGSYAGAYLLRRGLFMPWKLLEYLNGEFVKTGRGQRCNRYYAWRKKQLKAI